MRMRTGFILLLTLVGFISLAEGDLYWDPDVLIVEANLRYLSTGRAIEWMHRKGRLVIGWGLGAPALRGNTPIQRPLMWIHKRFRYNFLTSLDGVIAYSNRGAEEYVSEGIPRERVFIALNAVEKKPTEGPPTRPINTHHPLNALFVGRLQARKHLENLFQACANLPTDLQPHVWIIGDGPAARYFQDLANEIYPRTKFFGAKHGKELQAYFVDADIFVLPGTGGLAVQEAMAYGLPVIVAEGDGTQDDLVRKENGWLIPPQNPEALARALEEALANVKSLRRKGLESYRIVREEVNLENMVQQIINHL